MLEKFFAAWPDALHNLIRHGPLAVGTFFVLSGFVLQRSYASKTWTGSHLIRYGAARFARVYPVYALSLLLIAPIAFNDLFSSVEPACSRAHEGTCSRITVLFFRGGPVNCLSVGTHQHGRFRANSSSTCASP